jgi:hypothetical protein
MSKQQKSSKAIKHQQQNSKAAKQKQHVKTRTA